MILILILTGCTVTLKCTVLVDIIGNKKICTGFGMTMFAAGFTVFLGPSCAGKQEFADVRLRPQSGSRPGPKFGKRHCALFEYDNYDELDTFQSL